MVSGCGMVTRSAAAMERKRSLAPWGSTPKMRMAGLISLAMTEQPEISRRRRRA